MNRSVFVSGTDTGVGKTVVTALLALRLRQQGIDAGVMKPFATGCQRINGRLESEDARWLRQIVGVEDELELINPARWEEPLAPLVAARRAGNSQEDWIGRCLEAYQELGRRHDCVVVEGVGGLLVPLQEKLESGHQSTLHPTCADFAALLGSPVAMVARRGLGTINHTLLSVRYPLRAPARFAGLIFCDTEPIEETLASVTNVQMTAELCGLPVWGEVPYLKDWSPSTLQRAASMLKPNW